MRIGIDARLTSHGVGRYIEEVIKHLALIDKKNEFIVFVTSHQQVSKINTYGDNFKAINIKAPIFSLAEQFLLPVSITNEKLDIFHATSYPVPIVKRCPLVVTIHDLVYKVNTAFYPHFNGLKKVVAMNYYNFMNWYSIHFSSHIITVSEHAKKTIMNFYPMIHSKKIAVIYNGVSSDFKPSSPAEIKKMRIKFNISGKYILFVGTFNPVKNLIGLINAFAGSSTLREKQYKLVIASRIDPRYPLPLTLIDKLDIEENVRLLDYVTKEELRPLYSGAEVLVLPSFYESFGLPILEAFACGTPVITSDITAPPEIAADAALLIRPHDTEQLRAAIIHIISNKRLRDELVERGYRRIKQFPWEVAAEKVLKIYNFVHKKKNYEG